MGQPNKQNNTADLQSIHPGGEVWRLQHPDQHAELQLGDLVFVLGPQVAAESLQCH